MKPHADELRLLKEREPRFLAGLFQDVNPYLVRVCAANGIFGDEASELIHQAWEKFFENLEKFEGRSQLRTFICGILFNKIREDRRRLNRVTPEENIESILDERFAVDGHWQTPPPDPLRLIELREAGHIVQECLEGLNEKQLNAFLLMEVEEENPEDVCNILEVTVSHLRVLLFRAKEKLRLCLEGRL